MGADTVSVGNTVGYILEGTEAEAEAEAEAMGEDGAPGTELRFQKEERIYMSN